MEWQGFLKLFVPKNVATKEPVYLHFITHLSIKGGLFPPNFQLSNSENILGNW